MCPRLSPISVSGASESRRVNDRQLLLLLPAVGGRISAADDGSGGDGLCEAPRPRSGEKAGGTPSRQRLQGRANEQSVRKGQIGLREETRQGGGATAQGTG